MSLEMDDLELQVSRNTDVSASAVTLIKGLADQIRAAGTDPAKIRALEASIRASADGLASAVLENTDGGIGGGPIDDGGFDPPVDPNFPGPVGGPLPGDPFPGTGGAGPFPGTGLPGTTFPGTGGAGPFPGTGTGGVLPNDPFPGTSTVPGDGILEQDPNAPLGVMRRRVR